MIDHIWTVLCSQSIIDQQSNNISLIGVLEQLTIGGPTTAGVLPIRFEVVSLWNRSDPEEPGRGLARLLYVSPSESIIAEQEYDVDVSVYQRARTRAVMTGLPVQEAGRHHFRVQLRGQSETEWRDVASVPLQIVFDPSNGHAGRA